MYYKLRKKIIRAWQTVNGDDKSDFKHRWTPRYRLEYLRLYRTYLKTLKFEVVYE